MKPSHYIIGGLTVALLSLGLWLQSARNSLATAEAERDAFAEAARDNATAVEKAEAEKASQERIAKDAIKRRNLAQYERDQAQQELEDAKHHDPILAAYLDSPIHPGAVRLLWGSNQGEGDQGDAPGVPPGADAEAGIPSVSHQRGWQWCDDMEAAVDLCNGDKAAVRAWSGQQTE